MALSVEASELVELFQWAWTQSKNKKERKRSQIFLNLVKFADMLDMDLETQALSIEENSGYPSAKLKGKAVKYKDMRVHLVPCGDKTAR